MKDKFLATALIVLLCLLAYNITTIRDSDAGKVMIKASGETTSTTPATTTVVSACPSGTYKFAWNGDYTGDTDKGCLVSTPTDGSVVDVTIDTTTLGTNSTNKVFFTNADDYISWSGDADAIVDDSAGTIYFDLWVPDDHTTANTSLMECYVDGANSIRIYYDGQSVDAGLVRVWFEGNDIKVGNSYVSSSSLSDVTWYRVGVSWSAAQGDYGQLSINIDGGSWTDLNGDVTYPLSAWSAQPTTLLVGEDAVAYTGAEDMWIDNVYSLAGHKTSHPLAE